MSREITRALRIRAVLRSAREPSPTVVAWEASGEASWSGNWLHGTARVRGHMADRMRILSGMRPTGRFHLGNYLGAGQNWVKLQDEYDCYYFVADYHALTTEPDGHTVESKIYDLTADLIAVGLDPNRSVIYQQSKVPEVAELALLLSMVTPLSWVLRTPTFKEMVKKHPDNVNLGLLSYPVLQGADIVIVKGEGVPVGKDQLPHLELIREVVRKFNRTYTPVFPEPKALLTESPLIRGTDGKQRMSKSVGNIVGITEDPAVLRKQVQSMVTDVKRTYMTQPGHPRTCNVCAFYKFFFDDWQHYWDLCRNAQIGCGEKKKILAERMIEVFKPFREVRAELTPEIVTRILDEGSEKAREVARHTMVEVRQAVGLPPSR
jgi:tryptophanyl-tRNA synthetase